MTWDTYFNWYLEVSKCIQDSKIASLQNTISKLTEANTQLKENLKTSEASSSPPPSSFSQVPSCSSPPSTCY